MIGLPASATHHGDDVVSPTRGDAHQDVLQASCPILVRENTEGGSGEKNTYLFTIIDVNFVLKDFLPCQINVGLLFHLIIFLKFDFLFE